MRVWAAVIVALLVTGCVAAPPSRRVEPLFDDGAFSPSSERIDDADIFTLSDEMKDYLSREIAGKVRDKDPEHGLYDALYSQHQLKLEYDSAMTRNASQAFAARTGNCLSLVILTSAFAKELGLSVQYQNVFSTQTMSRVGDIIYYNGHVNVVLGNHESEGRVVYAAHEPMIIDFLPPDELAGQRARVIREKTIIAMFMNNRAAESLGAGRLDDAYWWARRAIEQDPTFLSSYNTLGVIYQRHGNLHEAERILKYIIELEPGNANPIANLVVVLGQAGREDEARHWTDKLRRIQAYPPFYYFDLGQKAMANHDYKLARDLFGKEIARAAYYHEFHAWLAAADLELGDFEQARKHLTIAMENSTTRADHDLYAARLEALSKQRAGQAAETAH